MFRPNAPNDLYYTQYLRQPIDEDVCKQVTARGCFLLGRNKHAIINGFMGTKKELPRITIMNLLDLFDLSFVGRRNSIALEFENRKTQTVTYTFGDLDRQSNRIAGLLESRSLKTGDRLCIYHEHRLPSCRPLSSFYNWRTLPCIRAVNRRRAGTV
mgnify:CR=1 FL=1